MKAIRIGTGAARFIAIASGFLLAIAPSLVRASAPLPGGGTNSSPNPLDTWSFHDSTGWTSDTGHAPISFTNLAFSNLGNGFSLVVDTNVPAWLQYNVYETNATTNLTVDVGTVMFWFAPGSWSSTNLNGLGPSEAGRLFEAGGYTAGSSYGWWSIYMDSGGNNLYFSAQTNDLSGTVTTYIAYPILWTTNYFHHLALTYCATNTALYLDGSLVTNGPPMTVYPGTDVLSNGFCIGSDTNGIYQAHGLFDSVATYNVPLDTATIQATYQSQATYFEINPRNTAMFSLTNALPSPDWTNESDVISGAGNLKTINYPLSTINYAYDALNRRTNMVDALGAHNFTWTPTGRLATENDAWTTNTWSYAQGLRTAMSLAQSGGNWTQSYGYDAGWRMTNTVSPAGAFLYAYAANVGQSVPAASSLVSSISLPNGANIINSYDSLARLTGTALQNHWGHVLDGYNYTPDPLGLRTNIVRNFGLTTNSVIVGYDNIAQITSWIAKESSGTLRQNEQLSFAYDAGHNLHSRTNGSLSQAFITDAANQLTNVVRTNTFTLTGVTPSPATNITVTGQAAQINGDFTFAGTNLSLANGQNTFTNVAKFKAGAIITNTFTVNLPQSVVLQFDNNGNLTNDGTRTFAYDSENQLTNVFVSGQWRSDFVYDGLNRRCIVRDYAWQSSTWMRTNEVHYVYDGYVLIQERDTNDNVLVTYTRGLDISQTLSRAGGIGGLLARTDLNGSTFYHADGNGNITALMDGSENIAARYLYNPYGKLLGQWGAMANINEMQFSSIPQHDGLSLYAFRAYEPNFQRWLNQDPLSGTSVSLILPQSDGAFINRQIPGELIAGPNNYEAMGNNSVNEIDPHGLILPELMEEGQIFWDEDGEAITEDLEADAEEAGAEVQTIWEEIKDNFIKAPQNKLNQGLGKMAENKTCPLKNTTQIPSLSNTAKYRVPDLLDPANQVIGDTKNVNYLSMSPQLQDFISWAAENGYTFQLTVSPNTVLSSSVVNAVPNIIRTPLP